MKTTARSLVLEVLAAAGGPLPVNALIRAAEAMGFTSNALRGSLVRLCREEGIDATGPGTYELGRGPRKLAQQVAQWRTFDQRMKRWVGGWLGVHTGGLGRTSRPELRRRATALKLFGFRELDFG